jgi:hypothetical protein
MYNYITGQETYQFVVDTYKYRFFIALYTRLILLLRKKKMILIFGMSRSGTSMLAKFLALGKSSLYIHEPDSELLRKHFGEKRFFTQEAFWDFVNAETQKEFKVHMLTCILLRSALKSNEAIRTIVIKPIALLEIMPEISRTVGRGVRMVYISRHPAGRTDSILRQLKHDQDIDSISLDQVEDLGRDWGRTNRKVQDWFGKRSDWHWVQFEALSNNPLAEFKKLYDKFGLDWEEKVQAEIQQKTTGGDGGFYDVQRDASKQADKWREALTAEQVEAIRRGCLPFGTNLYEGF